MKFSLREYKVDGITIFKPIVSVIGEAEKLSTKRHDALVAAIFTINSPFP